FDYILVDAGEGTTFNILDFFIVSDNAILVVLPQPDSIENTYRFIKKAFYRKLKKLAKNSMIRQIIQTTLRQKKDREIKT
ncbi:MAG: MinD/ParA family protein, partial [Candidatus Aminicenantes bacterium]|nr:MinD/ParA family protein [Candidatus Aminicenantes bacterium]